MRHIAIVIAVLAVASGCSPQPGGDNAATSVPLKIPAKAPATPTPVTLTAKDGVKVFGDYYQAAHPKALILLFHQAGSSAAEYATIAPALVAMGYSALAIDQRSGGGMFGTNRTAEAAGAVPEGVPGFLAARADMQAALDWAQTKSLPIVLWGSSYSSALIFPLAVDDPAGIKALLAFSPGEYFDDKNMVRRAAAKVTVPVLVASTKAPDEMANAQDVFMELTHVPFSSRLFPLNSVHGSSTLIAAKNPKGAAANWAAVDGFLKKAVG